MISGAPSPETQAELLTKTADVSSRRGKHFVFPENAPTGSLAARKWVRIVLKSHNTFTLAAEQVMNEGWACFWRAPNE
jgi:hypothetical protein